MSRYEEEVSKYKKGYPQEKKRIRSWCVFLSKVATCSGQNCHPQGEFFPPLIPIKLATLS
ncbi:hypothetical protein BOX24_00025 [Leptospirillum ferriphilum]|uniref:Uncharacterized protein n=2 Tax=Leptospirillum ferriphilum TaxID=178606 RepID=A0A1V3SZT2_9BACT|nr:integrase [Leptospirillum ferriphilum ML-04]OOH75243.1 hypothetical protein BOX24_00025 [Leptospirillum ferriphilum]